MFLFGAISGAFLCVPACFFWCGYPVFFVVLFLVSFGDFAGGIFCAFPGAFSTVFILVLFSVHFFVLIPFLFYINICFPLVVVLFFAVLFLVVFGCFFRAFFRAFFRVFFLCFFCAFYRAFFRAFFRSFSCLFSCFFFRALGGTQDKQPQYFAFWPVLFLVLFLVVTTSEDRIYTKYILSSTETGIPPWHFSPPAKRQVVASLGPASWSEDSGDWGGVRDDGMIWLLIFMFI